MNATFNPKRFFLLERYKKQETVRHLLWSTAIVLGICLLCMMYDINRGESYYMGQTQAGEFGHYIFWFLCLAPCLLEVNITKRTSTLYLLLPSSSFEKFLHIWLKYIVVLPAFCTLLAVCLKAILAISGIAYLQHFGASIDFYIVHKDQMLTLCLLQGIFFTSVFAFKRNKLIYAFIALCLYLILCLAVTGFMMMFSPADTQGYWMSNVVAFPIYNFALSPVASAVIAFCNYGGPALFIIGTWVSSYFLLKEKQL